MTLVNRAALILVCAVVGISSISCGLTEDEKRNLLCPALNRESSYRMITYEEVSSFTDGTAGWDVIATIGDTAVARIVDRHKINNYNIVRKRYKWSTGELVLNGYYGGAMFVYDSLTHNIMFFGDTVLCEVRYR